MESQGRNHPIGAAETPSFVLFEDEDLLVIDKPAGWNTHSPGPYAGEGVYEWLRHREPRWGNLAIIHRLDKETSGILVFGKSTRANRSLTEQFTQRSVRKTYLMLTDRPAPRRPLTLSSRLGRSKEKYVHRPESSRSLVAETKFTLLRAEGGRNLVRAEPLTGRTHQIRVQAAEAGFPVLGDALYGGSPHSRLCLHAAELTIAHPEDGRELSLRCRVDFDSDVRQALRRALHQPEQTDTYRLLHGAADGCPGWYVDRLGRYLLSHSEHALLDPRVARLKRLATAHESRGVYHRQLDRQARRTAPADAAPTLLVGEPAPQRFIARENRLRFGLSFAEGYSVGLFLDQRDNRRRLLVNHIARGFPALAAPEKSEVLNAFAYTCGFSLAAAAAGAHTTSLDLSRKYLDWGRANFELNGLDPDRHDFIYGDAFGWLRRLAKKRRQFDLVLLDPPTFASSKATGAFRAEKDFGRLVGASVPLIRPDGVLFVSTNARRVEPAVFLEQVTRSVAEYGRRVVRHHYAPQPPDFPIARDEPGYLKTAWLQLD